MAVVEFREHRCRETRQGIRQGNIQQRERQSSHNSRRAQMRILRRGGLLALAVVAVSACGIDIDFPGEPSYEGISFCGGNESPPASFKLTSSSWTLRPGQFVDIGVEVRSAQGAYQGCVIPDWTVKDSTIASVGFGGRLVAIRDGTTIVSASWNTFTDSAVVIVKTPVVTGQD